MTRTQREARQGTGSAAAATRARLRIRFPEGVVLQGDFGAGEPLTAVFEFVTGALRDAGSCYELVLPSRKQLPVVGCVRAQAELLPSCLLNFRLVADAVAPQAAPGARRLPLLSDAMLQRARVDA
jgi:UBX domain-containing protein 6